jgi:hypothetical protein
MKDPKQLDPDTTSLVMGYAADFTCEECGCSIKFPSLPRNFLIRITRQDYHDFEIYPEDDTILCPQCCGEKLLNFAVFGYKGSFTIWLNGDDDVGDTLVGEAGLVGIGTSLFVDSPTGFMEERRDVFYTITTIKRDGDLIRGSYKREQIGYGF